MNTNRALRRGAKWSAIVLMLVCSWSEAQSRLIFVDKDNTAAFQDGLSWATAVTSIRQGIRRAILQGGAEVWVASGEYVEIVYLESGVHLYGGFSGVENARDQRDFAVHAVVVNGITADNGGPAATVVFGADNSTLDGFTVRGGRGANGAGMLNDAASPSVANCLFTDNTATQYGGGILNNPASYPVISNCEFTGNSAGVSGGAIANNGAVPEFNNCTFFRNTAGSTGGGMVNTPGSSALITGCIFEENTATTGGGALFNFEASPSIEGCRFLGNTAETYGGAMFNDNCTPFIVNSVFAFNTSETHGGAFTNLGANVTFVNCTITQNEAGDEGGAFYNNKADPSLINCILWNNEPEEFSDIKSNPSVRYSNVSGGYAGAANINLNPRFVDPAGGDFRLRAFSRCINAGTAGGAPAIDIDGVARPQGAGIDIGAHEATEIGEPESVLFPFCGLVPEDKRDRAASNANAMILGVLACGVWFAARRRRTGKHEAARH